MSLRESIEEAFAWRTLPDQVVTAECTTRLDSDVEEALWFSGRNWHDLTWHDWQEHRCAILFFSPEAFAYLLPSIMILSYENPNEALDSADTLLITLDRSPTEEGWHESFSNRFLALRASELEVMKRWLVEICGYQPYRRAGLAGSGSGESFGRAFDTVELFQQTLAGKA